MGRELTTEELFVSNSRRVGKEEMHRIADPPMMSGDRCVSEDEMQEDLRERLHHVARVDGSADSTFSKSCAFFADSPSVARSDEVPSVLPYRARIGLPG